MNKKKSFNGLTKKTKENLMLDAGAFFKNFTVGEDTYETAKTGGKCIGATKGGGEFSAKPNMNIIYTAGLNFSLFGIQISVPNKTIGSVSHVYLLPKCQPPSVLCRHSTTT